MCPHILFFRLLPKYAFVQFTRSIEAFTAVEKSDEVLLTLPVKITLASSNDIPNLEGIAKAGLKKKKNLYSLFLFFKFYLILIFFFIYI